MAVQLPNGSLIHIASGYGAVKAMTAVTNASTAIATLEAAHAVIAGDFIEVTSGWSRLNNRIIKAGTPSTNDIPLTGIDSTSTTLYPAAGGTGSVREISGWTQLQQVMNTNSQGGEQQFTNFQFLEDDQEKRIPTSKSAAGLTIQIADDPTLAGYLLALAANEDRLPRAVRITLPSTKIILYNAYITLNLTPTLNVNEVMQSSVTLSLLAQPMRY